MDAMQLPNITHFIGSSFTYAINHFNQSSWKGKTVQVLCGLSLITFVVYLLRGFTKPVDLPKANTPVSSGPVAIVQYDDKPFYTQFFKDWTGGFFYGGIDETAAEWKNQEHPNWFGRMRCARKWLLEAQFETTYTQCVKDYPQLNSPNLLTEFRELKDAKIDDRSYCLTFKGWIAKLKEFDQAWRAALTNDLDKELDKITCRKFVSLSEYIQHLNPNHKKDGECFGIKREDFGLIGVVSMFDIVALQLQVFEPHIATLEQLLTCMIYAVDRKIEPPVAQLEQEIERFKEAIDKILRSRVSAIEGVEPLLKGFKAKLNNIKDPYTLDLLLSAVEDLKKFKNEDRERQRVCLKGYVSQHNIRSAWTGFFSKEPDGIYTLKEYCVKFNIEDTEALYQIGG